MRKAVERQFCVIFQENEPKKLVFLYFGYNPIYFRGFNVWVVGFF